jgi:GxxExxY protein
MEYLHADVTRRIIGASMKIHGYLGNGFQEKIYQRCLEIEFQKMKLDYEREKEQTIYYDGIAVGTRRVDFLVKGKILVELKAVTVLENAHFAQAINYLEAFHLEVGLLINFGTPSLQFNRVQNIKAEL